MQIIYIQFSILLDNAGVVLPWHFSTVSSTILRSIRRGKKCKKNNTLKKHSDCVKIQKWVLEKGKQQVKKKQGFQFSKDQTTEVQKQTTVTQPCIRMSMQKNENMWDQYIGLTIHETETNATL